VTPDPTPATQLLELRRRADEDFLAPPQLHEQGRHSADIVELGLRISITRSRYPNRREGRDLYAVTMSRINVDGPPDESAVQHALQAAFGDGAKAAEARPGGGAVRMFRIPAAAVSG
jgi:hypothetical protein